MDVGDVCCSVTYEPSRFRVRQRVVVAEERIENYRQDHVIPNACDQMACGCWVACCLMGVRYTPRTDEEDWKA